ncbi:MAG: SCO family protein [Myxococcales bacterium]|nr:SCO family protein [Myxococcales bacterium]
MTLRHVGVKVLMLVLVLGPFCTAFADADGPKKNTSLYQLDIKLTDQDKRVSGLDVFRGESVIVAMFYSTCNHTCPFLIAALKDMDAKLKPEVRKHVRFLLVSLDPQRDTPEALKAFAKRHALDLSRWKLAQASEGGVRELAYVLDIKYRKNAIGGYNHASIVTLLNPKGEVVQRVEGLKEAAQTLGARLNQKKRGGHDEK